jgi:hypothetical protein
VGTKEIGLCAFGDRITAQNYLDDEGKLVPFAMAFTKEEHGREHVDGPTGSSVSTLPKKLEQFRHSLEKKLQEELTPAVHVPVEVDKAVSDPNGKKGEKEESINEKEVCKWIAGEVVKRSGDSQLDEGEMGVVRLNVHAHHVDVDTDKGNGNAQIDVGVWTPIESTNREQAQEGGRTKGLFCRTFLGGETSTDTFVDKKGEEFAKKLIQTFDLRKSWLKGESLTVSIGLTGENRLDLASVGACESGSLGAGRNAEVPPLPAIEVVISIYML